MDKIRSELSSASDLKSNPPNKKDDNEFPATNKSLGASHLYRNGKWTDMSKSGELYVNGINPSDIRQGICFSISLYIHPRSHYL